MIYNRNPISKSPTAQQTYLENPLGEAGCSVLWSGGWGWGLEGRMTPQKFNHGSQDRNIHNFHSKQKICSVRVQTRGWEIEMWYLKNGWNLGNDTGDWPAIRVNKADRRNSRWVCIVSLRCNGRKLLKRRTGLSL